MESNVDDDLIKIDANPGEIELQTHLESSSQMINNEEAAAERDLNETDVNNLLPRIGDQQQQVRFSLFPPHLILLFMMTVSLFVVEYRKGDGYSISVISLGLLNFLLIERFLPIYRSMPPEKEKSSAGLRFRLIIWSLFTVLALVLVFLCSDLLSWKFGSTVAVHVVVFFLSVFLLATGRFRDCVLRRGRN